MTSLAVREVGMVEQHSKGKRKKTKEIEEAKQLRKKEKRDTYELPERLVNELVASDAAVGSWHIRQW